MDGPITLFEVKDLTVYADGDLAYSYSFQNYLAKMKAGGLRDSTVRVTDVYRKSAGKWLIVHEHVSVPVDLQAGKADLQSKPWARHFDSEARNQRVAQGGSPSPVSASPTRA